ncbi:MAG TPA: hypothetical protein VGS07_30450 [Thermoanaerobaculia bacterium]|nr:hypothetical protein [Thermoanaerobaculia bacterium]
MLGGGLDAGLGEEDEEVGLVLPVALECGTLLFAVRRRGALMQRDLGERTGGERQGDVARLLEVGGFCLAAGGGVSARLSIAS